MSDPSYAETGRTPVAPESQRTESLRDVTRINRPVYLAVVTILGVTLLIGVGGWLALVFNNRTMPDGLGVVIGTVAGGLVGLISGKDA
jgi:hypothetical protein